MIRRFLARRAARRWLAAMPAHPPYRIREDHP